MNIEKGIPLPDLPASKVAVLQRMAVGDSLLVSNDDGPKWRNAMHKASERGEFYFISRTVDGGVRIWRKA